MSAACDNAYDQMGALVDDRAGRSLVSRITQTMAVYELHGNPTVDKFSSGSHTPQFKAMSKSLKMMFAAQGLPPYSLKLRPSGKQAIVLGQMIGTTSSACGSKSMLFMNPESICQQYC